MPGSSTSSLLNESMNSLAKSQSKGKNITYMLCLKAFTLRLNP